ncbi:MAG: thioredoxin family protein [Rhodothermaceae bacterium]|nr:thioredoxin family protein [Rhodothermaceae bacterium]MXZ57400.1 thioredoxin family protein [Rhodothermaceae bacterium]MYD68309.1 thioredoxin family protein [Rhodothermaceae bacterium]MYJ07330.1 thioredoxin family protein [Rhodothermaceae bacterium]MYJ49182.1 thioredoxin family protein [Rhodothermaceae bacterium]
MRYLEWTMYVLVVVALLFFLRVTFFAKSIDDHGIVDTLPAMLEYFHEDQDRLVLIVLTPTCPYCLQSYPFYRTLVAEKSENTGVVAGINPSISIELQRRILQKENLSVDTLIALPNQDWGITSVPTIIILDDRARVEHVWVGLLDADREKKVLSVVAQNE